MYVRRRDTLIEVRTPAKINLFLEILGRRDDGYHEIETLMVPISIFDTVRFSASSDQRIRLRCRWASGCAAQIPAERSPHGGVWEELPEGEDNIATQVLERLRHRSGAACGASIELIKRIPAAAGLGGASSDAAAVLEAANRAWDLHWDRRRLADVAAEVGSDVPFFCVGGAAICRGRGQRVEPIESAGALHLVLVRPPVGMATADVYRRCRVARSANRIDGMLEAVQRGRASLVGRRLFNRLQEAAERLSPWIDRLRLAFARQDCLGHQMSGSGTSYFGICRHAGHARRVASRLRAARLGAVFRATTLPAAAGRR